jgi:hypothetical protein
MAVAMYTVNVSTAFWGHFLEGRGFPSLFLGVLVWARFLPWLSVVVVLVGVFAVFKASESLAMHCLASIVAITIGLLCVTAVGLSLPMSIAAQAMDRRVANQMAQRTWANDIPPQFTFITTNTTLQQVMDKMGKYDRVRGSGISYYEYDLQNGSAVLISPEWPFSPTNKIRGVTFYQNTNAITLYP